MLDYKAIEIFSSEQARCQGKPLSDAVIHYLHDLKIAARCIVTRGVAGSYENGEVSTHRLEVLSYNLPVRITIVLPAAQVQRVLDELNAMVGDGIVAVTDLQVAAHRVNNAFFPRQLQVRDIMTADPVQVAPATPLSEVARLLLSSVFTGLPVVDTGGRPLGVITQGDLIRKGGMPLRLGLLAESDQDRLDRVLEKMAVRTASDVMSSPASTIEEGRPLGEAVEIMLDQGLKRLPVVNRSGHLAGMLSRLDIFKAVMHEAPDWDRFREQKIEVGRLRRVADIARRDTHAVLPDTPVKDVIQVIDADDIQRVAVLDAHGRLLGLISDRDLLRFFKQEKEGIWRVMENLKRPF